MSRLAGKGEAVKLKFVDGKRKFALCVENDVVRGAAADVVVGHARLQLSEKWTKAAQQGKSGLVSRPDGRAVLLLYSK